MDDQAIQNLETELCRISETPLRDAGTGTGTGTGTGHTDETTQDNWLLAVGDDTVLLEPRHDGAMLRLTGEYGLDHDRVDALTSHPLLCRGMLRFNGDRQADPLWLGLQPGDEPSLLLTRDIPCDGLTAEALYSDLQDFVELYRGWFDATEAVLGAAPPTDDEPPAPPAGNLLKV